MEKVLVTGGRGFLGKYVVAALQDDHQVISFDNMDPICGGSGDFDNPYFVGDVRNLERLYDIVSKFEIDTIIHLAAYGRNLSCRDFPSKAWDVNVTGTKNVLEVARLNCGVKRVVVCSSNIVLSDVPTVYKTTKQVVEQLIELYSTLGVSVMGLRPSNIYGKYQSKDEYQPCAFAGLDASYAQNGFFTITGDGTQARDWVHAADVARAFKIAAESEVRGSTADVCTGILTSMNEVATMLNVSVKYTDARPGDAKELISDPTVMEATFGFEADIKLEDGIWDAFPSVPRL